MTNEGQPTHPPGNRLEEIDDARFERLGKIFADCSDRVNAGEKLDFDRIIEEHPDLAPHLASALEALRELDRESDQRGSSDSFPPGKILGDYKILRVLGRGGMGIVYEALQISVRRRVALKVLPVGLLANRQAVSRLKREAWAASRIDHPSICTVYDAGVTEGVPYIAMRYIDGDTLTTKISEAKGKPGKSISIPTEWLFELNLPEDADDESAAYADGSTPSTQAEVNSVLHFIERAARALHVTHEAGLVHRDIKPSNIMVTREDAPVILDFGLARSDDGNSSAVTQAGALVGTPAYMSPEQIIAGGISQNGGRSDSGKEEPKVDRRSDIFSLGVTFYECLTLRHPFAVKSREGTFQRILHADPPNARRFNHSVSRDLQAVVEKALEKDVKRRYRTALEFAEDLRRIREHEPIKARRIGHVLRVGRWTQRNPLAAALIVVTTIGFAAFALYLMERAERVESDMSGIIHENTRFYYSEGRPRPAEDPGLAMGEAKRISFGIYTYINQDTIKDMFDPVLAHLEKKLGVRIDMHVYDSYEIARNALLYGKVDFVRFGPSSYILAKEKDSGISLLAMEEREGGTSFNGHIVVHKESDIQSIADLNGKTFAFGDKASTAGRYLSQALLVDAGIYSRDLKNYEYHEGGHEVVANAVIDRKFDAGAITGSVFKRYEDRGLRSIASFLIVTKPWVASGGLDQELASDIRKCLLELELPDDKDILGPVSSKATGFLPPDDAAYNQIREQMKKAEKFFVRRTSRDVKAKFLKTESK